MREFLFKAKRKDNGEWVEGFLFHCLNNGEEWCIGKEPLSANDYSEIIGENRTWFPIDEKTICRYTGLTDKNGNKIWEKDIALVGGIDKAIVIYSEKYSGYILDPVEDFYFDSPMLAHNMDIITIVGNTIDNFQLIQNEEIELY